MADGAGVVMLAGPGRSTRMVYHALTRHFPIDAVIVEKPAAAVPFLLRRVKKIGALSVCGQLLFRALAAPWLRTEARKRIEQIAALARLDDSPIEEAKLVRVPSVNSECAIRALTRLNPRVVVVNGTRIISKRMLGSTSATFINMHAGITPRYRGVHGAYWALVENNRDACGVTVHLVDKGIDTGSILAQAAIDPSREDNFITYPLLQLAAGLPKLADAIRTALKGEIRTLDPPRAQSKLWSHPTLSTYLRHRWCGGVR
jgi:folate-dependent phosphoribosylglycinamide formyltransferase PurN